VVVYLIYLIVLYKYRDFQVSSYIDTLLHENRQLEQDIQDRKDYLAHINTNAFLDKVAKTSQNRKNPGEQVVFFVSKDDVETYKKIDVEKQMIGPEKVVSPTQGMSNAEKWIYHIFRVDMRDN
jgi:hypothetical protein